MCFENFLCAGAGWKQNQITLNSYIRYLRNSQAHFAHAHIVIERKPPLVCLRPRLFSKEKRRGCNTSVGTKEQPRTSFQCQHHAMRIVWAMGRLFCMVIVEGQFAGLCCMFSCTTLTGLALANAPALQPYFVNT